MFRGRYDQKVDEKGRTSLPRRFREELVRSYADDRLVVARSLDRCLWAYPYKEWEAFEARVAEKGMFDPHIVQLKRAVISSAVECRVDTHGRILVPGNLRQHAGIEHDVVWVGMIRHIEIWSAGTWRDVEGEALSNAEALGRSLADLGL
jgi:MraZ protein